MAISHLPKTVTKDVLFEKAELRFRSWAQMYGDPNVTASYMYEDMSASCYCGCPADDFPDDVKAEQDSTIRYQYKDGNCSFIVDSIEVEVMDLRSMRESPRTCMALYTDICVLSISYTDEDGNYTCHIISNAWLYGSTSHDFDEGKPVHAEFINAARDYIKQHHITKEMQEVPND